MAAQGSANTNCRAYSYLWLGDFTGHISWVKFGGDLGVITASKKQADNEEQLKIAYRICYDHGKNPHPFLAIGGEIECPKCGSAFTKHLVWVKKYERT